MVKCTQCNRQFKTKAAMEQHRRDAHAGKSMPIKAPVPVPQPRRQRAVKSNVATGSNSDVKMRFKRSELLFTGALAADKGSGTIYSTFSPSTGPKVLKKLAGTFEMYKIHSMRILYKSTCSTMRDGCVVIGYQLDALTSVSITKESVLAMPSIQVALHETNRSLTIPLDKLPRYVTKRDSRDSPFTVYAYWSSSSSKASIDLFDVFLEYDIELYGLNPT